MNYITVSSKEVIARLDNSFGIDNANWLQSAPLWIADALDMMDLVVQFEQVRTNTPLYIEDYKVALPHDAINDIKRIIAVLYDSLLLRNTTTNQLPHIYNRLILKYHPIETYTIRNGYIVTSFKEGEIYLYYTRPKIEYDEEQMIYYPYVPNNTKVLEAIQFYLMYCILRKGGRHDVYKLDSNSPIINPYLMFEKLKKEAKNSVNTLDPDQRKELGRMWRTFVINHDYNPALDFDNMPTNTYSIPNSTPNSYPFPGPF